MEFTVGSQLIWLSAVLSAALLLLVNKWKSINITKKRPPGPAGWPVFGNMFDLGTTPHQTLYSLRFKYGLVLWLKLGSVNTLVIQSTKAATELFKNHDLPFCDRKSLTVLTALNYYQGSLALGKYGTYWRILRRICTMELQGGKRINEKAPMRQKCVDNMIRWIEEDSAATRAQGESGEV